MDASIYSARVPATFDKMQRAVWTSTIESKKQEWKAFLEEETTDMREVRMTEWVPDGLWSKTEEGADISVGTIGQGMSTYAKVDMFSRSLLIPETALEDAIHKDAYKATEQLANSCVITQELDAIGLVDNCANASFTWGDGQTLASSTHPIRGGAQLSNVITAMAPSNAAVQVMLIAAAKMRGSNGQIARRKVVRFFGPQERNFRMIEILKSEMRDDTANHTINALKGEGLKGYTPLTYMASTTNWFARTDAQEGGMFFWRRKPRYRSEKVITNETIRYTGSARWKVTSGDWRWMIASLA